MVAHSGSVAGARAGSIQDGQSVTDRLSYPILVENGILARAGAIAQTLSPAHRYAVISDSNVAPLYAQSLLDSLPADGARLFVMQAGEAYKTRESWSNITDAMLQAHFGRDSVVLALGGGVVGDLAGFVAATFMRGVPVLQIPTSLLAMVDASVGGKTAVDTPAGKNLVGAFHPPIAVLADPLVLNTLPERELRAGFAEMIKHGVIADADYFMEFTELLVSMPHGSVPAENPMPREMIARNIAIKADIVARDEREGGIRKTLNFGHTIGHAIEALSGYTLLHGEAIAIGMALESALAIRAGVADAGLRDAVLNALGAAGLPSHMPRSMTPEAIIAAARSDKKARDGQLEFALPSGLGSMAGETTAWTVRVDDAVVRAALAE